MRPSFQSTPPQNESGPITSAGPSPLPGCSARPRATSAPDAVIAPHLPLHGGADALLEAAERDLDADVARARSTPTSRSTSSPARAPRARAASRTCRCRSRTSRRRRAAAAPRPVRPGSRACRARCSRRRGTRTRSPSSAAAIRASSSCEACGVPTQTAWSGAPGPAAPSASRVARSRARVDDDRAARRAALQRRLERRRLRRRADRVEQRDRAARGRRRADRLQAVLVRARRQADDDGDLLARLAADDQAEHRLQHVAREQLRRQAADVDHDPRATVLASRCSPASGTRPVIAAEMSMKSP